MAFLRSLWLTHSNRPVGPRVHTSRRQSPSSCFAQTHFAWKRRPVVGGDGGSARRDLVWTVGQILSLSSNHFPFGHMTQARAPFRCSCSKM